MPLMTPLCSASGTSDCGIAMGAAPSSFSASRLVPELRRLACLRSVTSATGLELMITPGGQVKAVSTFTSENSAGASS